MGSWTKKNVVVPVDFSSESFAAIGTALEIVEKPEHVCVLHVLVEPNPFELGEYYAAATAENRERNARRALGERLSELHYEQVRVEIVVADPPHGITDFAEKHDADLIVMPSHGHTGLKRLLIGSVTERVLRLAHCPVLVLRS